MRIGSDLSLSRSPRPRQGLIGLETASAVVEPDDGPVAEGTAGSLAATRRRQAAVRALLHPPDQGDGGGGGRAVFGGSVIDGGERERPADGVELDLYVIVHTRPPTVVLNFRLNGPGVEHTETSV